MAANRRKTIEYVWPTKLTTLATNTTLGTATRYDTGVLTVYIPETTSRNFLSVRLITTYHTEYTANNAIVGWRMGIQAGVGATVDTDRNISSVNQNLKNVHDVVDQDITAYFNANFGAGISQTVVASLAAATTVATNINNITFRLIITYEFDATAHNTRVKTIRIPIQSQIGTITTAQQEFGTDSTNPAPANQIPALDTFLPEGAKVYRQIFVELTANTASGAATNFTTFLQLDSAAEVTRATINEVLGPTAKPWVDIWDITGLITTNAVHALKARCDLTNRMTSIGGILHVTYEYSVAATVGNPMMCEAIVPLTPSDNDGGKIALNESFNANVAGDAGVLIAMLDVQEASPILVQSGVILNLQNELGQEAPTLRASGQPYRTYFTTSGGSGIGSQPVTHRCDQSSGWTLVRGSNRLPLDVYGVALQARGDFSGFAIINYTATCPADPDTTNHPVNYFGAAYSTSFVQTVDVAAGVARVPVLGSPYKISGVLLESFLRVSLVGGQTPSGQIFLAQLAGEWDARGFVVGPLQWRPGGGVQSFRQFSPFTRSFNDSSFHTGKLNIEADRRVVYYDTTAENHFSSWNWWITYHQMTFTVGGAVTIAGVPAANGKPVEVWAVGSGLVPDEKVTTVVIAGGAGAFSAKVLDNTRQYFASYVDGANIGRSALGAPV